MGIEGAIDRLRERFRTTPLNYTVEHSLVSDLCRMLSDEVGMQIWAEGNIDPANVTEYKRPFIEGICTQQKIDNVQQEVNVGEPGANRRIDVGVLSTADEVLSVQLVDGSKYYDPKRVAHAIEVKYIKNQNLPNARFAERHTDDWGDVNRDLKKLTDLSSATSRHLIIANNKDIFQRERTGRSYKRAHERYETLREECRSRGIKLHELHPKPR